jgi:hypothetical protein
MFRLSLSFRLNCYDSCNKAFFPSLFCQKVDHIRIELNGNVFDSFYKYPNPTYVAGHELDAPIFNPSADEPKKVIDLGDPLRPKYTSHMSMISEETFAVFNQDYETCSAFVDENLEYPEVREGTGRQERLHTCFDNCKDYIYDDFKNVYTFDNRINCTELA